MLVVIVILCPPLAVLLTAPVSQAVKNVGYTLLLYIPGVIHASAAVSKYNAQRRYATLVRVLEEHESGLHPPLPEEPASQPKRTKTRRASDTQAA